MCLFQIETHSLSVYVQIETHSLSVCVQIETHSLPVYVQIQTHSLSLSLLMSNIHSPPLPGQGQPPEGAIPLASAMARPQNLTESEILEEFQGI